RDRGDALLIRQACSDSLLAYIAPYPKYSPLRRAEQLEPEKTQLIRLIVLVRKTGLEPAHLAALEPKSFVTTPTRPIAYGV
ncbi:MAG: hypothetical protein Q8O64_15715, partial [Sideroxyarcus sp.]|nr:hypothetical protein [Sideroxyarcus sp.]